ncbi:MAG: hypothetical protein AAB263_18840 [Planctomycetota bacterium]
MRTEDLAQPHVEIGGGNSNLQRRAIGKRAQVEERELYTAADRASSG